MRRGAIIGFGNVAEFGHWPGYAAHPEVEIVAVVDASAERRARAMALKGSLGTFASLADLKDGDFDFVDICTPPAQHAEPMREAVARRQHVLCEKPFLLDHLSLDEVRALRDRYDLAVMPVHNWKYAPIIRAATDQLRQGTIGELCEVEITTLRLRDAIAADPAQPSWRRDPILAGGGILMDHGWHALYLALDFFRDGPIETSATLHRPNETAVEDEARVELQFPSGTARIELSWNAPVRANRVKLIGTRGAIVIDDDTLDLNGKKSRFPAGLSAGSHHAEWFTAMLPDVIAAFDKPELSRVPFEEAALCLTIIQRCYAEAGARPNDR